MKAFIHNNLLNTSICGISPMATNLKTDYFVSAECKKWKGENKLLEVFNCQRMDLDLVPLLLLISIDFELYPLSGKN